MKTAIIIFFIFFFSLISTSPVYADNHEAKDKHVIIQIKDVMKALEFDYFRAEERAFGENADPRLLKMRIKQMQDSYKKIVSLNKNKQLHKPLKTLKSQLTQLEKSALKSDQKSLKRVFAQMYSNCFQCHKTHRKK